MTEEQIKWATSIQKEMYCIFRASQELNNQPMKRFFLHLMPYMTDADGYDFINGNLRTYDDTENQKIIPKTIFFQRPSFAKDWNERPQFVVCSLQEYYEKNREMYLKELQSFFEGSVEE